MEQVQQDDDAHVRRVPVDSREPRRDFTLAGSPTEQDQTGDTGCDVGEKREAGDSSVRRASHIRPPVIGFSIVHRSPIPKVCHSRIFQTQACEVDTIQLMGLEILA
jgi:hypothetical protein